MSYEIGWAAMNLEMAPRVPRVEFDAERHWPLVKAVTGIEVSHESPRELQHRASLEFVRAWHYDTALGAAIHMNELAAKSTSMGHAVYAAGGVDYNDCIECPFESPEEVLAFDPWEFYGERDAAELIRRFEEDYHGRCRDMPDLVNMSGVYITCVSGLIAMFGWEMLLTAAGLDPEGLGEVTNRYAKWIAQYYHALADTDVPVIYSHDDIVWTSGAVFRPDWYRRYVFPNLKMLWEPLLEAGKKILFISDGDYTEFVDDIVACGAYGFFMEPLTDMAYVARKYGKTHVIIGNADTRALLSGDRGRIRAEVQRCMDIGRDCPGWFMGVTNMIPPNTPVESALYYNEVYEELCRR